MAVQKVFETGIVTCHECCVTSRITGEERCNGQLISVSEVHPSFLAEIKRAGHISAVKSDAASSINIWHQREELG